MIERFDGNEVDYLAWVEANPEGFVVNVDRGRRYPQYPMVHRSTHRLISSPERANYTTNEFIKHCSTELSELEELSRAEYGRELNHCATCMSPGRSTPHESGSLTGDQVGGAQLRPQAQTQAQRALRCLDILVQRRDERGLISPMTGAAMLEALQDNPRAGVALGQARSLLQLACVKAHVPLIDQLIVLGTEGGWTGAWQSWVKYQKLLQCAPRLTIWRDSQVQAIRTCLMSIPGGADAAWRSVEGRSAELLDQALEAAQTEIDRFVREAFQAMR